MANSIRENQIPQRSNALAVDSCLSCISALQTPYDVVSLKGKHFSGGPGCFAYFPDGNFEYIPKSYLHFKEIKDALLEGCNDKEKWKDASRIAYGLIVDSLRAAKILGPSEGTHHRIVNSRSALKFSN